VVEYRKTIPDVYLGATWYCLIALQSAAANNEPMFNRQ